MKGKKHTSEQIIAKLHEAKAELNGGATIGQVCQKLGVTEPTFHRWRDRYGGMKSEAAKRLKELEEENRRLKHGGGGRNDTRLGAATTKGS
jgi:putative transposase